LGLFHLSLVSFGISSITNMLRTILLFICQTWDKKNIQNQNKWEFKK
jgi:hypothetical protein